MADVILIRRCQAGDEEAFGLLFEQYKNLVYRTTYLTLGAAADADDILQEVFLQVHRSLDSLRSGPRSVQHLALSDHGESVSQLAPEPPARGQSGRDHR